MDRHVEQLAHRAQRELRAAGRVGRVDALGPVAGNSACRSRGIESSAVASAIGVQAHEDHRVRARRVALRPRPRSACRSRSRGSSAARRRRRRRARSSTPAITSLLARTMSTSSSTSSSTAEETVAAVSSVMRTPARSASGVRRGLAAGACRDRGSRRGENVRGDAGLRARAQHDRRCQVSGPAPRKPHAARTLRRRCARPPPIERSVPPSPSARRAGRRRTKSPSASR